MTLTSFLYDSFVPLPPVQCARPTSSLLELSDTDKTKTATTTTTATDFSDSQSETVTHQTQRRLSKRMIYLISFLGVIGTAVFVSMGSALHKGGPLSLLLGFAVWCIPILCINECIAEMTCYLPIPSPFISMGGRCCSRAMEITMGWNFWFLQAALIPYEVVGVNTIIHYWRSDYSPAIPLVVQIVLYFLINVIAVEVYGEIEFWLSLGKILLAIGIMLFTFITMLGGNPIHDRYGFRYWNYTPYSHGPMNEFIGTGDWGRFLGFFQCVCTASFTIAGPEYVAMTAAETINPRVTLTRAFSTMFYRLAFLFLLMCLCMGIVCYSNDKMLIDAIKSGSPGAAASPFVIAMINLKISVLPDIVNVVLILAAFSSGNSYTFTSSRTLYGLAKQKHAPGIFAYCTKKGTPIYAILASLAWSFLSFLQLGGDSSYAVLNYIVSLVTVSQLLNYFYCCMVFLFFYKACLAQGINRSTDLPFVGKFQPGSAIIGMCCAGCMSLLSGYSVFISWDVKTFIFDYVMIAINIVIFLVSSCIFGFKFRDSKFADLKTGLKEIEEYEIRYNDQVERMEQEKRDGDSWKEKSGAFWGSSVVKMGGLFGK